MALELELEVDDGRCIRAEIDVVQVSGASGDPLGPFFTPAHFEISEVRVLPHGCKDWVTLTEQQFCGLFVGAEQVCMLALEEATEA